MSKRGVLTVIWFLWGALLFLVMIAFTMQSALFGDDAQKAWQWFLPNLVPVLTLVGAGAYAMPAASPPAVPSPASGTFLLAVGSSIFYLLLLTGSILSTLFSTKPLDALTMSGLWLGPIQGIATSGLALYFVKR